MSSHKEDIGPVGQVRVFMRVNMKGRGRSGEKGEGREGKQDIIAYEVA